MKSTLKSLMSVAAAALALTSCSTDATEEVILKGEPKTLEVNASIEQTRTTMAANHVDLEWSEGDQIKLYIGDNAAEDAAITHTIGDKTITAAYKENDNVYARYTIYDHDSKSNGVTAANIEIPKTQQQAEAGVFAGKNLPMVAAGTITDNKVTLNFNPVGCVLVFNVYGPAEVKNETIKSIMFETSVGCSGYTNNDLTANPFVYTAHSSSTSATVELTTFAPIGTEKPGNTLTAENQIYLVVAPVADYPVGSKFIVKTDDGTELGKTYTFITKNILDCKTNTARVVNLNLAKSSEMQPAIEVPTVEQLSSNAADNLSIKGITFKNIADADKATATVDVYGDEALTQKLEGADAWLTITSNGVLADGTLNYSVAANETSEARTAYIVIECAGAQAVIPITQVAKGASTEKYYVKVTEAPANNDWSGEYLIVCENSATQAYVWTLQDKTSPYHITAEISNSAILSSTETDACKVVISKSGEGYLLYAVAGDNADKYIYGTTSGKTTVYFATDKSTAEQHLNKITIDGSDVKIGYSDSRWIQVQNSSTRFRFYAKQTSGYSQIKLYKLQ